MFEYFNGFWTWANENNEKNSPNITSMYFYLVHIANELGWVESFTITSTHTMHHLGIGAFKTYKDTLDKLEQYGLICIVERSKNQFTSTRIALVKMFKAKLKAGAKQSAKQVHSIVENTSHIHKTIETNRLKDLQEVYDEKTILPKKNIGWWKEVDAEGFKKKLEDFRQYYPIEFLTYFSDYYTQESERGGIHVNHEEKFSLEAKLRQFWSDPKTKQRFTTNIQRLPDEITSKPNEELAERIERAQRYAAARKNQEQRY